MPFRYLRKFLLCLALIVPYPDVQSVLIIILSVIFLFYFMCYMPAKSFLSNAMNIAIESSYVILGGMLYGYDKLVNKDIEEQKGFSIAMIVGICLMLIAIFCWVIYRGIVMIS